MVRRLIYFVLLIVVVLGVLPVFSGIWVKCKVEKRLKIKIEGEFLPILFQPSFVIRNIRLDWKDKIRVNSGNLVVRYDLLSLLPGRMLRVQISSGSVRGELLGDWLQKENMKQIVFRKFEADLGIGAHGIQEINALEVEAPNVQLRIGRTADPRVTTVSSEERGEP